MNNYERWKKPRRELERRGFEIQDQDPCYCGCGETANEGSYFKQGHDAGYSRKLLLKLIEMLGAEPLRVEKATNSKSPRKLLAELLEDPKAESLVDEAIDQLIEQSRRLSQSRGAQEPETKL